MPDFSGDEIISEGGDGNSSNQSIEKGISTLREKTPLHDLDPSASHALHDLISLVHDHVNAVGTSRELQHTSPSSSDIAPERDSSKILVNALSSLEDDRVAHMLWNLEASKLRDVLLAMAVSLKQVLLAHFIILVEMDNLFLFYMEFKFFELTYSYHVTHFSVISQEP